MKDTRPSPVDAHEVVDRLQPVLNDMAGSRLLLTGAAGFLGRHFIEVFRLANDSLLDEPIEVTAADNYVLGGAPEANEPNLVRLKHDIREPLPTALGTFDFILHAAGIASPFHYRARPIETLEVSVAGTRNTLELAEQSGGRHLFFSSSEVYGDPDPAHVPMMESYRGNVSTQGPRACYDEGKRVGETLSYIYHEYKQVPTNVVRPFNVYGPGIAQDDYRVMPSFALAALKGEPLRVFGSGSQTRTFCYVTDAIVGFMLVAAKGVPGQAYNIGNPSPEITMIDLAEHFHRIAPESEVRVVEYPDSYPADEPMRRVPDIEKARLQLGYEPRVTLDEGLERFMNWASRVYAI